MSETNRIEYKRELNTKVDIEKEVIAFLNYHEGGLIYMVSIRMEMFWAFLTSIVICSRLKTGLKTTFHLQQWVYSM